jgi:multimeric flavodoxin WrbA
VEVATVRLADHHLPPGVESDLGDGDDWPAIRARILDAEILVVAKPTWVGHPSSFAQRALSGWTRWSPRPTTEAARWRTTASPASW